MKKSIARALYIFSFILRFLFPVMSYGEEVIYLKEVGSPNTQNFCVKSCASERMFIFVAPECSACRRQVKDLSCLNTPVSFISLYGNEKELIREKRRLKVDEQWYLGSKEFISKYDLDSKMTPQILLAIGSNQKIMKGFHPCEEILREIERVKSLP